MCKNYRFDLVKKNKFIFRWFFFTVTQNKYAVARSPLPYILVKKIL